MICGETCIYVKEMLDLRVTHKQFCRNIDSVSVWCADRFERVKDIMLCNEKLTSACTLSYLNFQTDLQYLGNSVSRLPLYPVSSALTSHFFVLVQYLGYCCSILLMLLFLIS